MAKRGNGEGSIFYSEKLGRWVGQFTAGRKDNGKLNRKSVYGKTRKEVKEKVTKALAEIQNQTFIEKDDITINEIVNKIIEDKFKANKIKEVTYLRNIGTAKILAKLNIATKPIQSITFDNINSDLAGLTNYSESIISKVVNLIGQAFNYAVLHNIIKINPFNIKGAINIPNSSKEKRKVEAFTIDEEKAFLNELNKSNDYYKDVFYFLLYTGARVSEILALKGSDIDLINNTINITKTLTLNQNGKVKLGNTTKTYAGKREVPILASLKPIANNYASKQGFIFLYNNNLISKSNINAHFKKICKNANIKVVTTKKKKINKNGLVSYVNLKTSTANTHMLRHTFATRCIESGINPVVLQKILGHKDIQVTLNTYTSVFDKFKNKEIEKIENYFKELH